MIRTGPINHKGVCCQLCILYYKKWIFYQTITAVNMGKTGVLSSVLQLPLLLGYNLPFHLHVF